MNIYEYCKMPIRIAYFGFILIAFGFLIQNESVNIFYTFTNTFLLMFAEGCLTLGKTIILNLPLIFMIYLVCKKANSGVPIVLALLGYFAFLITTSLFASQTLSSYAYTNNLGINSIVTLSGTTRYPLETGMLGSFIVAYISRYSFIRSRHRTSHSVLGFLNRDSAAIVYNIVFCTIAGILASYIFPVLYTYLSELIVYISKDLADPLRIAIYGVLDRSLSILGLGNFIRNPFWYTVLGGSYQTIAGQSIVGDVNIWAYIKDIVTTYSGCGRFITPYYVINIFICPAMYFGILSSISDKQERNRFIGPIIMASLLSIIAGNPLPLELVLLFTCPLLLLLYLLIVGAVFGYMTLAGIFLGSNIANASSAITAMPGNFPDLIINLRSVFHYDALLSILLVGAVAALICYCLTYIYFHFLTFRLVNSTKDDAIINETVEAIGGYDNIENVGSGLFRVNFSLIDNEKIDIDKLKTLGLNKIAETKNGTSIEFGSSSYIIAKTVKNVLKEFGRSV